jgi:hypothetical protein
MNEIYVYKNKKIKCLIRMIQIKPLIDNLRLISIS